MTLRSLRALVPSARLAVRLLREPRVPFLSKLLPIFAIVYFVSPIDFVPDLLMPILGEIDDVVVVWLALQLFPHVCPAPAVEYHRAAMARGEPYSPLTPGDDFIDI